MPAGVTLTFSPPFVYGLKFTVGVAASNTTGFIPAFAVTLFDTIAHVPEDTDTRYLLFTCAGVRPLIVYAVHVAPIIAIYVVPPSILKNHW